jgi:predicted RNase H-like HicB family nuclease
VIDMADLGLKIETEVEDDGRWMAEVVDIAGVMAYGASEKQAIDAARVLALEVMTEKNQRPGELA